MNKKSFFSYTRIEYILSLNFLAGFILGTLYDSLFGLFSSMALAGVMFLIYTFMWRGAK